MRPIALDTRRLVSSEFPQCKQGTCVPAAKSWVGLDGQTLLLGPTVRVKRRLHFRYADALPVAECTQLEILDTSFR